MDKLANGKLPGRAADGQNSSLPRHHQIADVLRRQIASGTLLPGDEMPSEHDLMRQFGVSRGTPLTQPLSELVSFTAWVRSLGKEPGGEVISFARERASAEAATALGLSAGDAVWRLERVRSADGERLLIERTVFPEPIGALLAGVDLETHSVYEQLARRGVTVSAARHLIDAVPATSADARLLDIAPGSALLRVVRQATAADGRPVEWSDDRYRGDGVNFAIENRAGDSGLVRQLSESEDGRRKTGVGSRESGVGSRKSEVGSRKSEDDN